MKKTEGSRPAAFVVVRHSFSPADFRGIHDVCCQSLKKRMDLYEIYPIEK